MTQIGKFANFFINLGDFLSEGDFDDASEFVCSMYAQSKVKDVDEARYKKLISMTGKVDQENPLASIKKLDCALLPPTRRTLEMKKRRANYVTMLWNKAATAVPGIGLSPCDNGWCIDEKGRLHPSWFDGPAMPDTLYKSTPSADEISPEEELSEPNPDDTDESDTWSEDSASDSEKN